MSASPVTLMVARRVANSRYQDFNRWLNEGRELAADFPGYLGPVYWRPLKKMMSIRSFFALTARKPFLLGSIRPLAMLGLSGVKAFTMRPMSTGQQAWMRGLR